MTQPNKMPYMLGYCPQCDTEIMVRDCTGRWSARKRNFAEARITFENGAQVQTIICKDCLASPDLDILMTAILHEGSQAIGPKGKELIGNFGKTTKILSWSN